MVKQPGDSLTGRLFRYFSWCAGAAILFVLVDYMVDLRPAAIDASYEFRVPDLEADKPLIMRQGNLAIVVIKRSPNLIEALRGATGRLQDPGSRNSRQPDYAANGLRSKDPEYFVAYAIGTDLGCLLQVEQDSLGETCGPARYDFAGRSYKDERDYRNLPIPDYNFSDNFQTLTIRP